MGFGVDFIVVQDKVRESRVENDVDKDRGSKGRLRLRERERDKIVKFEV